MSHCLCLMKLSSVFHTFLQIFIPFDNSLSSTVCLAIVKNCEIPLFLVYWFYEEEDVYLQIQKALKPMRIQTIIYTYMVMAGTVLICIETEIYY